MSRADSAGRSRENWRLGLGVRGLGGGYGWGVGGGGSPKGVGSRGVGATHSPEHRFPAPSSKGRMS